MLESRIISKRYAKAFFEDIKPEEWEQALDDIKILRNVFNKHLISILNAPIININEKYKIIEEITKNLHFSSKWKMLFDVMEKKMRITTVPFVLTELENLIFSHQNKEKVKIILAYKIKADTIKKIEKKISEIISKEVVSEIEIDPSILGGFIAQTESVTINGSIKGNLLRLKNIIEE